LQRANLQCADLTGAQLRGANLTGAQLYDANLTDAMLYKAKMDGQQQWDQACGTRVTLPEGSRGDLKVCPDKCELHNAASSSSPRALPP
jgi:uncharacterized protein YjbI with pentapeptide repeats